MPPKKLPKLDDIQSQWKISTFFNCFNTESKAELAENVANIKTTKMRLI